MSKTTTVVMCVWRRPSGAAPSRNSSRQAMRRSLRFSLRTAFSPIGKVVCVCPRCQSGKLGPLTSNGRDDILRYRCNKKGCQRYFLPQHLHPFFTATNGPEGHSLQMQAAALLLRLLNVPLSSIHLLTHINHKALEKFNRNILLMRKGYVQKAEKEIKFGGCPRAWKEVEADEATFDKKTLSPQELGVNHDKPVLWEQWGAIVQRGAPETLVLTKLNPAMTVPRAPGPGAIRKVDWKPLALKHIANRNAILHTDSARSYKMKLSGVVHDAVVHKKKRVKKNGKWVWLKPTFVRISKHKLPDGRRISCKAGTQIVDRAWKFMNQSQTLQEPVCKGILLVACCTDSQCTVGVLEPPTRSLVVYWTCCCFLHGRHSEGVSTKSC